MNMPPDILIQELIEFKKCLEKFKIMDDEFDEIYNIGKEPDNCQVKEFAKLKSEYEEFREFFNRFDYNFEGQWTPESIANELVGQIFR